MAMFSFGAWLADEALPDPKPTTGIQGPLYVDEKFVYYSTNGSMDRVPK